MPLVSIILPTCDRPEQLMAAVGSIKSQTLQDFEVIVINDGRKKTDLTFVPRIRLIHTLHQRGPYAGPAIARNLGLQMATGKYIAFLDDDDVYSPKHLETLVEFLEADPENRLIAYTDTLVCKENETSYLDEDFDYQKILKGNFISIHSLMINKRCFDLVGGFDTLLQAHEDWDLWIRLSRYYAFHHIPKVTVIYNWHPKSITWSDRELMNKTFYQVAERYRGCR